MSKRILVVDDDATIRTSVADALRDENETDVAVATSVEAAIARIDADGAPDLVLTDLRMRGLDGMDLLRHMRDRDPGSRVVVMTAYHDVATAVEAMREGAADFLCKPFDLGALRAVVARLLGPASAARAAPASSGRPLADRYTIEEEVGRGAMAIVYRAVDRLHGRSVAVKVLRPELLSRIGVDRFLGEVRIVARLQHPHVLTLIDSGRWDGKPYFVMPFVSGPSLRRVLNDNGRLGVSDAAALLRDVADALAAAHAVGVVHRDVKPENVLLSGRHAWVADFGVARALSDATDTGGTLPGSVPGTPAYMAPEQAWSDAVDARADIYALGVVAYELLSGSPPFAGPGARAILAAHLAEEPVPLRRRRPEVPEGLEQTVMRCLRKDPGERWADAASVSRSFGRFAVEGQR